MSVKLSKYTLSRDNNFNLVRFVAATMVIVSHSYPLVLGGGAAEPFTSLLGISLGSIAVDIFFVTSGFLITSSLYNRKNLISFVLARILRIIPALFIVVLLTALVLGTIVTNLTIPDYLSNSQVYLYIAKNTTLLYRLQYDLPGVFGENIFGNTVNGSLWTLPWEVKMYILLGLIAFVFRFKIVYVVSLLTITTLIIDSVNHQVHYIESEFYIRALHFIAMFFSGSMYYILKEIVLLNKKVFYLLLIALLFSMILESKNMFYILYIFTLPYIILYLSYIPAGRIRYFNIIGDYSYGLYIYAFPIQQSLVFFMANDIDVFYMFYMSFIFTLLCAVMSWHIVERPLLSMKDKYER